MLKWSKFSILVINFKKKLEILIKFRPSAGIVSSGIPAEGENIKKETYNCNKKLSKLIIKMNFSLIY